MPDVPRRIYPHVERYGRHILIPEIGEQGQAKLSQAKIVLIGAGGLGSSAALYLAAVGVGTLAIMDHDVVQLTNLNRQILYGTEDLGGEKASIAAERIAALNPEIKVKALHVFVTTENVAEMIRDYDIVIDATDSLETKFMLNDACVQQRKILIHAGVEGFVGQVMTIIPGGSCLRCFMPQVPHDRYSKGLPRPVLGVTAGLMGQLQAAEAIKCLLDIPGRLIGTMLFVDLLRMDFKKKDVARDPACPVCGEKEIRK